MHAKAFRPSPSRSLVLSIALLLLALAGEWGLRPVVGHRILFVFFFPAVGVAAMWLGWKAALLVLAGGVVHAFFWLGPLGTGGVADRVSLAAFLAGGGILLAVGAKHHQLRFRASDAERMLSSQVQDLQSLHDLGNRISLLPDLPGQLAAMLRTLCELQGAQKGVVAQFNPASASLRALATVGFSAEGRKTISDIPVGQGASGLAFVEQRVVVADDTQEDAWLAGFQAFARAEGIRCVHSRPMFNMAGQVFGVLSLHFKEPTRPTARHHQLGDLVAQMAAVLAERESMRQDALALSRKVEVALESSAVPFSLWRPLRNERGAVIDFSFDYLNKAAAEYLDRNPAEVIGRAVGEVLPGTWDEPGLLANYVAALDKGATVEFEAHAPNIQVKGWFHVIASPCEGGLAVWFSDITERRYQEQALREADRRKDEFLATLAHELRNPLAPIRQAAMIARSPGAKPEQQRWSMEVIERQVNNMAMLLDDLLDVSRITRGKLELRRTVTDLREAVDSALEAARPIADERHQHLLVDWPETPLWAMVDRMRIAQVISNLLTNASKYTQPEGTIRLAARLEGGEAVIDVADNGIGIPPDALERVFEMFTQVHDPHSGATAGLGIGLALSRGLAQMHGATLTAHSEGLGRGSTFTLRLELCEPPPKPASQQARAPAGGARRRVLVADDNRDAAESLAEFLRIEGHEVTLSYDGVSALDQYRQLAPEIVLLDIGMPGMNGNEVASAIRSSPGGEDAVLVAITGWGQERDRRAAREAGFDFHFTKPVNPEQVLKLVEDPVTARALEAHS